MDDIKELTASQIAAVVKRLKSKPVETDSGTAYDGRFLARDVRKTSASSRDRSEPILRGHFTKIVGGNTLGFQSLGWETIPWLPGVELRYAMLEVYCPYCDSTHWHGWPTFLTGRYMEYRGAHCSDHKGKRARTEGYWIAPWRQKDEGSKLHVVKPGLIFPKTGPGTYFPRRAVK